MAKQLPLDLTAAKDEPLGRVLQTILQVVQPVKVILFGSRATGLARVDSDYDLLIIEAEPFSPQRSRRREAAKVWRALAELGISSDILMYSQAETDRFRQWPNHVIAQAFREGQVLYERSGPG
ncbi:MAG: nucleotidyltransferase domain-containing protein [Cyanobacteria bacterium P01_A01_bin.114]